MNKARITTNILQVIKNKQERNKAVFVYSPLESYYLYKGDKISQFHLDLILPITPQRNIVYL